EDLRGAVRRAEREGRAAPRRLRHGGGPRRGGPRHRQEGRRGGGRVVDGRRARERRARRRGDLAAALPRPGADDRARAGPARRVRPPV
ncbi:MAG: Phosphoribosyl-ATP pyrophosphatase, partial [uncultured Quadrisphaera sp.]